MLTNDLNLLMRFKRQPRIIGTRCQYIPQNRLLKHQSISRGETLIIVGRPDGKSDLFVNVVQESNYNGRGQYGDKNIPADNITEWLVDAPLDIIHSVMWKDLGQ